LRVKLINGCSNKYSGNYREKIRSAEGMWLEIDTDALFKDQLNTKPINGVSNVGLRIYQTDIERVEDDERIGRSKCDYCGAWTDTGKRCPSCNYGTQYMVEFFPGTIREAKTIEEEVSGMLDDVFPGA